MTHSLIFVFSIVFLLNLSNYEFSPIQIEDCEKINELDNIECENGDYKFPSYYAKLMVSFMNSSVDPCEDFYEYSCGNWKNTIEPRQTIGRRNNLLDIKYKLSDITEKIILNSTSKTKLNEELQLAQIFYESCLLANLDPPIKSDDYLNEIKRIGGFPVLDSTWNSSNFDWFNMSAHLTNFGVIGFINDEVIPQYPFLPYFKLPELGFDVIAHLDNIQNSSLTGYTVNRKRMETYLSLYGVQNDTIDTVINDIFALWVSILKVAEEFDDDFGNCIESEPFQKWNNYYTIAWGGKDFKIPEAECPCDLFFNKLEKICSEQKEAAANYLAMKFLFGMDARLKEKTFQKDYCISSIQYSLQFLIDEIYIKEYFDDKTYSEIDEIIEEVRQSLQDILLHADWLDNTTRTAALEKESNIKVRIGRFQDADLVEKINSEIKQLSFEKDTYEKNNLNLRKFKTFIKRYNGLHFEELTNDTKPLELLLGMQVNAFYYNIDNSINVMAGILHPPVYHKDWPIALKYGTLGYLIGHESTHGFDTIGAQYDKDGNAYHWWTKKSRQAFEERTNCFVEHYNNYFVPEIKRHINGKQTKDENIADSGGLREAWTAYHRHVQKIRNQNLHSVEYKMPELKISSDQLFFLAFTQLWCSYYEEEHYWAEILDEHTVDKYRVLGVLRNMPEFSNTFSCSVGSYMNPNVDKCQLW